MATTAEIEYLFPKLKGTNWRQSSLPDPAYNCHAFAAGSFDAFWQPPPHPFGGLVRYYWPPFANAGNDVDSYASAFAPTLESGVEKIALYERGGRCTHTARQLESG